MSQQGLIGTGSGGGGVEVETLTGNTGGPVPPTGNNINIIGSSGVNVAGNPGTSTLTITAGGSVPLTFTEDSGSAVPAANNLNVLGTSVQGITTSGAGSTVTITATDATTTQKGVAPFATDAEAIAGTVSVKTIVPTSLKAKLGVQTNNGISYGTGTTTALAYTSGLTDGQIPIGSSIGIPAAATITAGSNITITNGHNSITIASGTGAQVVSYTAVSTSPYVVLASDYYLGVTSSGGAITVQLPNAPTTGRIFAIKDTAGSAVAHNISITTVGGAVTIDGQTTYTMATNFQSIDLIFNGTSYEVY